MLLNLSRAGKRAPCRRPQHHFSCSAEIQVGRREEALSGQTSAGGLQEALSEKPEWAGATDPRECPPETQEASSAPKASVPKPSKTTQVREARLQAGGQLGPLCAWVCMCVLVTALEICHLEVLFLMLGSVSLGHAPM